MKSVEIVAIVGSLRTGSANAATARAAASLAPDGATITLHDVSDVPFYNGDVEQAGLPPSVSRLHELVGPADGLLLFSPEYNGSFPAVTKNVIDWLTRPPKAWEGTALSLIATTPGPRAGTGVRDHFSAIMAFQPIRLFETLGIGRYGEKIVESGELEDGATRDELAAFVARFADFCRQDH
ncbi:MAG: NADPH-dependent FMN reductase [Acidimicrobiales bacterium]